MPKVSVFTASHNVQFLDECYRSLAAQTFDDWEWVVLLNHNAIWVPPEKDPRVRRESHLGSQPKGVGHMKAEVVKRCTGELLVELDHDDVLTPDALAILWQTHVDSKPALIYSDFSHIDEAGNLADNVFNPAFGWDQSDGVTKSFGPYPSAVSYIWYAPNHVKAFPREAYDAVGGYDPELVVLDDQDLIAKLYQYGDTVHLSTCLYKQRVHPDQTQARQDLNLRIQTETVEMYHRTIQPNAVAWAKRNGLGCYDMGGAHNSPPDFQSVDRVGPADFISDAQDFLHRQPDDSVGVIRCSDFLEHLPAFRVVDFMNECYRVLAHGGMMLTSTPSTDGRGAFQDPTHISFWNENSFWYYTDANYAKYVPAIKTRFMVSYSATGFPSDWHRERNIPYITANLVAVKNGPRLPGELLI